VDDDDKEVLYRLDEHVRNHLEHVVKRVERLQYGLLLAVAAAILVDIFVP
jgi:hypothetical protein